MPARIRKIPGEPRLIARETRTRVKERILAWYVNQPRWAYASTCAAALGHDPLLVLQLCQELLNAGDLKRVPEREDKPGA